jgi:hypothetical protein
LEEAGKEMNRLIGDCDGQLETVGDGEKLFRHNLKMHIHNSSGKYEHVDSTTAIVEE